MILKKGNKALNTREKGIIKLVCKEYSSQEIGEKLGLSSKTIENYIGLILKKTKSKNRIGIVIYAIRNGIYKLK